LSKSTKLELFLRTASQVALTMQPQPAIFEEHEIRTAMNVVRIIDGRE